MVNKKLFIYIISFFIFGLYNSPTAFGYVTIDPTDYYAWNDIVGWIDFYNTPGTIHVSATAMTGYADSSVGEISLDCATSPTPPADCAISYPNWKVTRSGTYLSGWAWNEDIGWISFDCHDNAEDPNCLVTNYQVTLDGGTFSGWAWNDVVGWISFNCSNTDSCAESNYRVKTTPEVATTGSLVSSTFDTGSSGGVVYNTIMYQGSKPTGTEVKFQLAVSDSSEGPWNFSGYDGTDTTYYTPTGPNIPRALNPVLYNNKRYFRYKIIMTSDAYRDQTPQVDRVIVNWSR